MMTAAELVFEGQTFQIARRSLVTTCELFLENPNLLSTPYRVRSRGSEKHFRVFLAAIKGATTEIGLENAIDLESLSTEFQFVELGRRAGEFVSQHPHFEVVRLKSAISDLQRQLAGQNREFCQLAEANGRARAERDSQLEGLWGAIDEVATKQRHEREKVSLLQKAMGEVRSQIGGVTVKLSETEKAVERAALGLAETKDRISRVESDAAGLRAAITERSEKVEDVRREIAGLKAELSDCCPTVKKDLANLEQKLAKLKEEIRAMKWKREFIAPPAADVTVPPAPKAASRGQKSSNSPPSPEVTAPPPKMRRVKMPPPPAPPKHEREVSQCSRRDHRAPGERMRRERPRPPPQGHSRKRQNEPIHTRRRMLLI
jgi:myosin heavy subunit